MCLSEAGRRKERMKERGRKKEGREVGWEAERKEGKGRKKKEEGRKGGRRKVGGQKKRKIMGERERRKKKRIRNSSFDKLILKFTWTFHKKDVSQKKHKYNKIGVIKLLNIKTY